MKLETTVPVTHADVTKKLTGGSKQGIVTLEMPRFSYTSEGGIQVPYTYYDVDGNVLPTNKNGVFVIPADQVKPLSQSIHSSVPAEDNIEDRFWSEVKIIAMQDMATQFSITTAEIVEI